MPVGMRQYFVPVWLDVDHRKLKAEIAPDKEIVRTVAEHVSMLPPARNAFLSPSSYLSSPLFPRGGLQVHSLSRNSICWAPRFTIEPLKNYNLCYEKIPYYIYA